MAEDRPPYSLRPWAWVAWLPLAVVTFATTRRSGGAYAAGAVAGSIVVPVLISWLAWKFGRPSAKRASIVFVAVVLVSILLRLALVSVNQQARRDEDSRNEQVLAEMSKETEALRDRATAERESGGGSTAAGIERSAALMETAGKRLEGSMSAMMLAVADAYRELLPAARTYDAAWSAFGDAGGVGASALDSREEVRERVALARSGVAASRALRKTVEAFPATAEARIAAVDASAEEKRDFTAGMKDGLARFVGSLRNVDHDVEGGEIMAGILELLDEEWGRWSDQDGQVDFESPAAADDYNARMERLRAVLAAQEKAAGESLGAESPPAGSPS